MQYLPCYLFSLIVFGGLTLSLAKSDGSTDSVQGVLAGSVPSRSILAGASLPIANILTTVGNTFVSSEQLLNRNSQ